MIPLRDRNPATRTPYVTRGLIVLHVAVWVAVWSLGPSASDAVIRAFGVTPVRVWSLAWPDLVVTPITSMLLHAGWAHALGNVWFLHVFGDNVEDHLGHARFLALYVLSHLFAVVAFVALVPAGDAPLVGASGAISGVLGAYMIRYPRAPILAWFVVGAIELPALVFLLIWFAYQLFMAFGTLASAGGGGVAFSAHVAGFAAGMWLDTMLSTAGPARRRPWA